MTSFCENDNCEVNCRKNSRTHNLSQNKSGTFCPNIENKRSETKSEILVHNQSIEWIRLEWTHFPTEIHDILYISVQFYVS